MSCSGNIEFEKDGKVAWFEYNSIVDFCRPKIYETYEELVKNWRCDDQLIDETCEHELEDVTITVLDESGWEGKACRKCMCMVEGLRPYYFELEDDEIDCFWKPK